MAVVRYLGHGTATFPILNIFYEYVVANESRLSHLTYLYLHITYSDDELLFCEQAT